MEFILIALCTFLYYVIGVILVTSWFNTFSWLDTNDPGMGACQSSIWPLILVALIILKLFTSLRLLIYWVGRNIFQIIIKIVLLFY